MPTACRAAIGGLLWYGLVLVRGTRQIFRFVFDAIVVELKAVSAVTSGHEAQLFNYMRIARQPVGYLVNFGSIGKLERKRFILADLKEDDGGGEH